MTETRRGKCPECGIELSVTAAGGVRTHGYARGQGDTETARCPGSGKPPVDAQTKETCFYCNGTKEYAGEPCKHCEGTGQVPAQEVEEYDAVVVAARAMGDRPGARSATANATLAVHELMKYGFIQQPEEAPNPKATGWAGEVVVDDELKRALLDFFTAWADTLKGPVSPRLMTRKRLIESLLPGGENAG